MKKKIILLVICVIVVIIAGVLIKKVSIKVKYNSYLKQIEEKELAKEIEIEKEKQVEQQKQEENVKIMNQEINSMLESGKKESIYKDASGINYKVTLNDNNEFKIEPYIEENEEMNKFEIFDISQEIPKVNDSELDEEIENIKNNIKNSENNIELDNTKLQKPKKIK